MNQGHRHLKFAAIFSLLLGLLFIIACGTAAPDPDTPPAAGSSPVPTAEGTPTPAPTTVATSAGAINAGLNELATFMAHPRLVFHTNTAGSFSSAPISEGLFVFDLDMNKAPGLSLAEDWSISADFTTWTFNLRQGIQFHKGYGEMTAEDAVWSFNEWAQNEGHTRHAFIKDFWQNPAGSVETPDSYTVVVNTGEPMADIHVFFFMTVSAAGGTTAYVASKKQAEQEGEAGVDQNIAGTGPWEIVEHRTGQFWRMRAVENHWRQTPHFEELVFWEIPEESARLAGFQTGRLDTFVMDFDSIPLVESVQGARLMQLPDAGAMGVNFYGNYYLEAGTPEQLNAYDPGLPWVSSDPELGSPEWVRARQVRLAMSMAIDRQALIETLLRGFAQPAVLQGYTGASERLLDPAWEWEFDPGRARQLLAEAGYPDGFDITLTTAVRNAPAEVPVCEAIGTMWQDVGINVRFQRVPYSTLRPQIVARNYQGATCHGLPSRMAPAADVGSIGLRSKVFNYGWDHPWFEDRLSRMEAEVDPTMREDLEQEVARFLFDEVVRPAVYTWDAVWPVGPRIDEWTQPVGGRDLRFINGYEYIQPRQ